MSTSNRSIVYIMSFALIWLPVSNHAHAQEKDLSEVGRESQDFGDDLFDSYGGKTGTVENGVFTIDSPNSDMNGQSINVNDLYPGTSSKNDDRFSKSYKSHGESAEDLQDRFESSSEMGEIGKSTKESLWEDANSDEPSISGAAYKVLLDTADRSRPDMSNDPILNTSKSTFDQLDVIAEGFGDCSTEVTYVEGTIDSHVPEYEVCERIVDRSGQCEVVHEYDAKVLRAYDGSPNIHYSEPGVIDVWIGEVADNNLSGNCTVHEFEVNLLIEKPEAITDVVLERVVYDDHARVSFIHNGQKRRFFQGPYTDVFPQDPNGPQGHLCDMGENRDQSPERSLYSAYPHDEWPDDVQPGDVVTVLMEVSVGDVGEGYTKLRFEYDEAKAIVKDEWSPQECLDTAVALDDGFAEGEISCIEEPYIVNGCTTQDGIEICESDLGPSPLPGISRLCKKALVETDYNFYKGQMECWTDPQGVEHCPENDGGNLDSCTVLEQNNSCSFVKSECIEGTEGSSGTCYAHEDTYDCGYNVSVPTVEQESDIECSGPIRCMGDDCIDVEKEQSQDFARTTALLNAAQFMTQDMSCTGLDEDGAPTGEEEIVCSAFGGSPGECKTALGGTQNCCEKPTDISMADYLQVIMALPKYDAAITGLSDGNVVKGAYQTIRDPAVKGWSQITKPFASHIENISGATQEFFEPVTNVVESLVDSLKEKMSNVMTEVIGNAGAEQGAASAAGSAAGEEMAEGMANNMMNMMSTAMTVYSVYVVAMVMIQMIYECEEEEFQLNAQRALNNCTALGSYCKNKELGICIEKRRSFCCFNSPLSRIVQEQVRPQLGMDFGSSKNPECGGIPLDRIEDIDWDQVDLDEWLGILQSTGNLDSASTIDIDTLTGSGNALNIDDDRKNAAERSLERYEGISGDEKRREAELQIFPDTGAP